MSAHESGGARTGLEGGDLEALSRWPSRRRRARSPRTPSASPADEERRRSRPWCEARRIDHAWMPEGRRFADLKLLAMDMDSTLITIECIDELGDLAGKKAESRRSPRRRCAARSTTRRACGGAWRCCGACRKSSLQEVYDERLRLTPGAEGCPQCKQHGVKLLLVSGGFTFFTERLKAAPRPRLHHLQRARGQGRQADRRAAGRHRRRRRQGGEVPRGAERAEGAERANRGDRRRRQRPEDDGRGRPLGRLPRQAAWCARRRAARSTGRASTRWSTCSNSAPASDSISRE